MAYSIQLILLPLALLGLLAASFLRFQYTRQLRSGKKSLCLIGSDCFEVTSSKYGRTLGFKNEDIGIIYYLLLFSLVTYYLIIPKGFEMVSILITGLSLLASGFSLYLLSAQVFVIKKYCFLCLLTIVINFSILLVSWILLK